MTSPQIDLFGVPLALGSGRRGVDMGPSALRIAGLGQRLQRMGFQVVDKGDVKAPIQETLEPGHAKKLYIDQIAATCECLAAAVLTSIQGGALPVVLGGDHSVAVGSVAAVAAHARAADRPIGLLWVDAHGDMNTPESTESGNVHGMPLAALLGPEPAELSRIGGPFAKAVPATTILIGVRDLDEREKRLVKASGVHVFTMKDIDRAGIGRVTEEALAIATAGTAGIHVSFDMDVCDPAIAPGVGTPVSGGLDYREAHTLMEMLADSRSLLSLDIVEVNPVLDVRNATAVLATELVLSAFGRSIL